MELSLLKLQELNAGRAVGERRRRIRHKLHSPIYATFSGPNAGMVLELNELLDLSEEGFAVQADERLQLNQSVTFSLDLAENKTYVHGAGRVIWSDRAGRKGVQFFGLTEQSQRTVKEWLLMNLLVAATKNAQRKSAGPAVVERTPAAVAPTSQPVAAIRVANPNELLSGLDAVRSEVCATADFNAALHLITERALSLTGASGAALAFVVDDKIVCRASTGEPAMPLGTAVDVKHGLTGECVRSGRMVACEDTENDGRVDQEICRMLGIGSILATPVVADFRVVGVIEVFSPHPRAFGKFHETALDRLAELVPKVQPAAIPASDLEVPVIERNTAESAAEPASAGDAVWEQEREAQEPLRGVPVRLTHIILLGLTVAVLAMVSGYLLAPKIEKLWLNKPVSASGQVSRGTGPAAPASRITPSMPFADLRKLAEQGDVEAQWEVGSHYRNGDGVVEDNAEAVRWFQRAAEQGHMNSQRAMGFSYWAGRGVPRDLSKAYFWSVLAARQGDEISGSQMQGLALQMTAPQVAAAQQLADDWLNKHRTAQSSTK